LRLAEVGVGLAAGDGLQVQADEVVGVAFGLLAGGQLLPGVLDEAVGLPLLVGQRVRGLERDVLLGQLIPDVVVGEVRVAGQHHADGYEQASEHDTTHGEHDVEGSALHDDSFVSLSAGRRPGEPLPLMVRHTAAGSAGHHGPGRQDLRPVCTGTARTSPNPVAAVRVAAIASPASRRCRPLTRLAGLRARAWPVAGPAAGAAGPGPAGAAGPGAAGRDVGRHVSAGEAWISMSVNARRGEGGLGGP
jgi:hypothetical protein